MNDKLSLYDYRLSDGTLRAGGDTQTLSIIIKKIELLHSEVVGTQKHYPHAFSCSEMVETLKHKPLFLHTLGVYSVVGLVGGGTSPYPCTL